MARALSTLTFANVASSEGMTYTLTRYEDGGIRCGDATAYKADDLEATGDIITMTDDGNGVERFNVGDSIVISGCTTVAANNGTYTIVSASTDDTDITLVVSEALLDDANDEAVVTHTRSKLWDDHSNPRLKELFVLLSAEDTGWVSTP